MKILYPYTALWMVAYARLGIDEVIVMPSGDRPDAWIEDICGEAVARLVRLTSAI